MFAKLLMDSREFFTAAKREWDEAAKLVEELKERPAGLFVQHRTGTDPHLAVESARTVAMMNYTTAMELLLKAFVCVKGRFDDQSLRKLKKINHKTEKVLDEIQDWEGALEVLFAQSGAATVPVVVHWNWWNPPGGEWIEDTERLKTGTLREFLRFLRKERMHEERFSFERIADDDFRIKIAEYRELELLHKLIEEFLCDEAEKAGCFDTGMQISFAPVDDKEAGLKKVKFATTKDAFEFDKLTRGREC